MREKIQLAVTVGFFVLILVYTVTVMVLYPV
jgi:hypothetical protein